MTTPIFDYDVVIVGGGPAGVAAAVYCGRKQLTGAFITDTIGGQSIVSSGIENWIGDLSISGIELAEKLKAHAKEQETIELMMPDKVSGIEKMDSGFRVKTEGGKEFTTMTVILTTGGRHRHLNVPGEEELNGKGVAYCATCDAPFFRDRDVAVVGGGNSGLEAVVDLMPFAKTITILSNTDKLTGDPITQKEVLSSDKVKVLYNTNSKKINGEKSVEGLVYEDTTTGEEQTLAVQGVFVEVGVIPNTDFLDGLLELNKFNEILIDHKTCETSVEGIYAAGDATDEMYKQNNIAVGDAIKASLSAYAYITKKRAEQKA